MARAKINEWGDAVVLKLSFAEAAALHALVARVGPETDEGIHADTEGVFHALERVTEEVEWPADHAAFLNRSQPLVDPGNPED